MELKELYQQYKARKLAADQAAKEEEKYKKLLKEEMAKAGVKNYTDEDGYLYERITQERKSMDEKMVLESLKERGLTGCIKTVEAVDEAAVLTAIEEGEYPAEELQKALTVKEVVMLKMTAPGKTKKK
jgi:hypothetical protein